jgi:hypothetical protein
LKRKLVDSPPARPDDERQHRGLSCEQPRATPPAPILSCSWPLPALGLVLGGWLLGGQIKDLKLADRYVTVRGLVERTVKSDTAIWNLSFKEAGNDLSSVFTRSETDKTAVFTFLKAQGFKDTEITIGQIQVTDRSTMEYGNGEVKGSRYIVQQAITAVTPDVDKAAGAGERTAELVRSGIALGNNSRIVYKFNGLNALKPDMITEATRNARTSAQRFAADSGSVVGAIRSATQGIFSITAADAGSPAPQGGRTRPASRPPIRATPAS